MNIQGEVVNTSTKAIVTKAGKALRIHYIELDSGECVNVGFSQNFKVGQKVSLNVEAKYGELKLAAGPVGSGGSNAPALNKKEPEATPTGRSFASGRPFPVPKTSGEMAIIRQNALTNAVTLFCNGALEFVPDKENLNTVDKLVEEVLKVAYQFADFSSGNREIKMIEELDKKASKRARKVVVEEDEGDGDDE